MSESDQKRFPVGAVVSMGTSPHRYEVTASFRGFFRATHTEKNVTVKVSHPHESADWTVVG